MKSLRPNWFFEDLPDFEYKKYVLLAYLQDVHSQFTENKLYPALSDLVFHYRNLTEFLEQKQALYNRFPEQLTEIDIQNLRLAFTKVMTNDELMNHLEEVVQYSIPALKKHLDEGREIYEFMEQEILIAPVGILPIYRDEGYMLVRDGERPEIRVYEFAIKLFTHNADQFRSVQTEYLTSYKRSIVNTSENIKIDMIRHRKKLPNPATFAVESAFDFPIEETILPVAKRMLVRYLAHP
jgi:hypothetical protein